MPSWQFFKINVGKWMSLCCTVGYKWVTVMDGVKFEFNDTVISHCIRKTILGEDGISV